eukprot:879893-Pyramimonas_sp.AAC.1
MCVGGYLEPSGAILRHLGGHLGVSEVLPEPWATMGPLAPRASPPLPGPGGRGSEEGQDTLLDSKPSSSLPPALPTDT